MPIQEDWKMWGLFEVIQNKSSNERKGCAVKVYGREEAADVGRKDIERDIQETEDKSDRTAASASVT